MTMSHCPHCQAELTPRARFCWLCGNAVAADSPIFLQSPGDSSSAVLRKKLPAYLPLGIVALVIVGTYYESPGLAILLVLLLGPALLVTYARSWSRERRVRQSQSSGTIAAAATAVAPLTGNEKAATFLTTFFVTFATVAGTTLVAVCVLAVYAFILFASVISVLFQLCGISKP